MQFKINVSKKKRVTKVPRINFFLNRADSFTLAVTKSPKPLLVYFLNEGRFKQSKNTMMAMADTIKKTPADPIPLADGRLSSAEINFRRVEDNKLLLSFSDKIRSFNLVMLTTDESSLHVHKQIVDPCTNVVAGIVVVVVAVVDVVVVGAGVVVVTAKLVLKNNAC